MICENIGVTKNDTLSFARFDTAQLAKEYGTPLYLMDENRIRERCQTYLGAMKDAFGEGNYRVLYASKAACFKQMYRIMQSEGMGVDVVSKGEILTASEAGFDMKNVFFHSSNKTDSDIAFAIDSGVGFFIADNKEELIATDEIAESKGVVQRVILRLTPGIDPHTYDAVATGKVDSKFGTAIETGEAEEMLKFALTLKNIKLVGFHCHVGSQVFDSDVFIRSADIMLDFCKMAKDKYNFETEILDLGGGYGVRYVESDPTIDIAENIKEVGRFVNKKVKDSDLSLPQICMEPGRSIVADAGMTLYTVGMVKKIEGVRNFVSVDGGMADNIRYALYGAPYTVLPVRSPLNKENLMIADLVGRCCESGDVIQPAVPLPQDIKRGDLVATLTSGAYQYSMASNYNRVPRPPIVMLKDSESYVAVRRETEKDIVSLDI